MAIFGAHKNSADCIKAIFDLHFRSGSILDVNFGKGVFYKKMPDRNVVGLDILPKGNVIADNKALPFVSGSFDVGVCDPPYKRGNRNRRYTRRYGEAPCTEPRVTKSYFDLLPELIRVSRIGIIVKCQDCSDGHRFRARHIQIIERVKDLTGLDPHDIAITARFGGPNNTLNGKQRFFQQSFSYFMVWKWKENFKPVRF